MSLRACDLDFFRDKIETQGKENILEFNQVAEFKIGGLLNKFKSAGFRVPPSQKSCQPMNKPLQKAPLQTILDLLIS